MDWTAVTSAIREVAADEVTPRFGKLLASDISEKTPGEVVTEADHACEKALTERLRVIRDIPVVGEEATAGDISLPEQIGGAPAVWLVDPLDGTSNFVAGSTDHSVMVALVEHGMTVASWIWHPQPKSWLTPLLATERGSTMNRSSPEPRTAAATICAAC